MALPADFSKIFGSTATGGLTPIGDVNYAKGWEFVGANPPTKNDFSYLQNLSDLKSQWLYSNKLQRADPFGDIKSDGTVQTALENLGLGVVTSLRSATFTASGSWTCPDGVTQVLIDGCGGGGGGACGASGSSNGNGGGGAAAVMGQKITVVPGTVYQITIGTGGAGGTSATTSGGDGGTSSFGSLLSLPGGGGGTRSAVGSPGGAGGINGQPGSNVTGVGSFGGSGGGSLFGGGGAGAQLGGTGRESGGFGGGGGAGTTNSSGARGANGFIKFSW